MMRKGYFKGALIVLTGVFLLFFIGCAKEAEPEGEVERRVSQEGFFLGGEMIADQETYEAAIAEGKLQFYTAHTLAHEEEMARIFMRRFPEIDVEITRAGGSTLHERMLTEEAAGKLKADVVVNSDTNYLQDYLDNGWIVQHIPPSDDLYPEAAKNAGYVYPTGASAIILAYHAKLVSAEEAPKDWADLADSKWKGKLGGQRLGGGAMWSWLCFLRNEFGTDLIEQIGENKPVMYTSGSGLATALVGGEIVLTPMGLYAGYPMKYNQGAPIELVFPESGFPLYIPGIAILKFGENPNAAKLFVNWYLSREGQSRLSQLRGQYSLREDVLPATYLPLLSDLNYWIPESELFLDAGLRDEWIQDCNKAFGWD